MKFITEFRDQKIVNILAGQIRKEVCRQVTFMEVCGGHTMSIQKFGIPALLPPEVRLVSGPGCPVCVTGRGYIDRGVAFSRLKNTSIATYGDLIRVPGSTSTLERERSQGADIRIIYSVLDAVSLARENPAQKVIFMGIGFETTAPASAAALINARKEGLQNFFLYSAHKIMPPAMEALISDGVRIDGYIAPGHVSAITGTGIYRHIPERFGLGCVISGFEPVDILESVLMLVRQVNSGKPAVEIQYKRAVRPEGNPVAQKIMEQVFETRDDWWRGLGILKNSGLRPKVDFERFDAEQVFDLGVEPTRDDPGCLCGEILKGIKTPGECPLFGRKCTPDNPVGACMVSHEGSCHAHYRYKTE